MAVPFLFISFFLSSFSLSLLSFSVFRFVFRFVSPSCRFSVCFLYRLLRFSFSFSAFLDGRLADSVILLFRLGATPPPGAACEPEICVNPLGAVLLLALFLLIYLFFFFSPFFDFEFGHRLFHPVFFLWVTRMPSPRCWFLLRLV